MSLVFILLCLVDVNSALNWDQQHPWLWSRIDAAGFKPAARQGHASVEVGRNIYVIGGCKQQIKCYNDVHLFSTENLNWQQQPLSGQLPEPRGGHSASLSGRQIVVFGGANGEETFGDLYKFDLVSRRWHHGDTSSSKETPASRTNHAAVADRNGLTYVFGGSGSDGHFFSDLWVLNISNSNLLPANQFSATWIKPSVTGQVPQGREGHSLTLVDRKLVLFGGYTDAGMSTNDLHIYDIETQDWKKLDVMGFVPMPRQFHSAVRHGRDVVIAAGCNVTALDPRCFNDVWSFNMYKQTWTKRSSDRITFFAREGHSATFVRGKMFVFGGCQWTSECYNDMTVLDTFDACPALCGRNGKCINEEFCNCTTPGFTGHDCLQPVSCRTDCGPHGSCGEDGECICEPGWAGPDCAGRLPHACFGTNLQCNGHGSCHKDGKCECFGDYIGEDCSIAPASASPTAVFPKPASPKSTNSNTGQTPRITNQTQKLPMEHGDSKSGRCERGCCSHGTCNDGICECQIGWTGLACEVNTTIWESMLRARTATHLGMIERVRQKNKRSKQIACS